MKKELVSTKDSVLDGVFALLPVDAMPDEIWLRYAWMMAAGSDVFDDTQILSVADGTIHIRCFNTRAVSRLSNPQPILEKLRLFGCRRKLPRIDRIAVSVGNVMEMKTSETRLPVQPDDAKYREALEVIEDPALARMLAVLVTQRKNR